MASIGDLFWTFRGDGARLTADAQTAAEKAGTAAGKTLGSRISAGFKNSVHQGFGVGAGISAFNLLDRAASSVVSTLGDVVSAGMDDEESQSRLAASLKANVPAWNGNTDAIERRIAAGQRLGFEDEKMRDSLAILVGSTHDITKAFDVQAVALDLARFKRVDLQTASEALIKVEGGVYRSLKSLGIVLRDGATQEEALAAVRKVTMGQAEAYAQTNRGKLLASQVQVNEAMENLGTRIMPIVIDAFTAGANAASSFIDSLTGSKGDVISMLERQTLVYQQLGGMGTPLDVLAAHLADLKSQTADTTSEQESLNRSIEATNNLIGYAQDSWKSLGKALDDVVSPTETFATKTKKVADASHTAAKETKTFAASIEKVGGNAGDAIPELDELFGLLFGKKDAKAARAQAILDLRAVNKEIADFKNQPKAKQDPLELDVLNGKLADANKALIEANITSAALGDKPAKDALGKWIDSMKSKVLSFTHAEQVAYDAAVDLAAGPKGKTTGSKGFTQHAAGGYAPAGTLALFGEQGPELGVPRVGMDIIPAGPTQQILSGLGGTTNNIKVDVTAQNPARDPLDIARQLRRLAEMGLLTPKKAA